jgi:transcriptional regulator with XRE-family HTH domain
MAAMLPKGYTADAVLRLRRLRYIRERFPMSQEELAARSGVNRVTISRLEVGQEAARSGTIRKLARALRVKAAELYGEED